MDEAALMKRPSMVAGVEFGNQLKKAQAASLLPSTPESWSAPGLLTITDFIEKPSAKFAAEHLKTSDVPKGQFLGMFGQYVLR